MTLLSCAFCRSNFPSRSLALSPSIPDHDNFGCRWKNSKFELALIKCFRIEKLEMLDEVNLFYELLNHYCISWAFNDSGDIGKQCHGTFRRFEKIMLV